MTANCEINREEFFQIIRITRDMLFEELKGRHTSLEENVPGILLNKDNIDYLINLSDKERNKCFEMLETKEEDQTLALVQGYLCLLRDKDFIRCDKPKMYPVSGEII